MRRTLPALPGVTAIAFRELSYPQEQALDSVKIHFSSLVSAAVANGLGGLLETVESRLDSVYELQSEIFSSQFLLLQICELLGERIVTEHFDPVLKVTAPEMELEGSKVDGADDSKKIRKIASGCSRWSPDGSVEVERILRRYTSKNVRSNVSQNLVWHSLTCFQPHRRTAVGYQTLSIYLEDTPTSTVENAGQ